MVPEENHADSHEIHLKSSPEVLVGRIVRERRIELGLRQVDLEGDEGIDRTYISKLENGKFQPCLRALIHLEEVLGFQPGYIFVEISKRLSREQGQKLD